MHLGRVCFDNEAGGEKGEMGRLLGRRVKIFNIFSPFISFPYCRETSVSKLKAPQMVSLFPPSEVLYDRYAAAIAATEPLRVARDKQVLGALPAVAKMFSKKETGGNGFCTAKNCDKYPEVKQACMKHVMDSSKVIRALGMTVAQFNDVSRKLGEDELLRERVMEQAYLYRVASTLSLDKVS